MNLIDGRGDRAEFKMSVLIRPRIVVEPKSLYLGLLTPGEKVTRVVKVTRHGRYGNSACPITIPALEFWREQELRPWIFCRQQIRDLTTQERSQLQGSCRSNSFAPERSLEGVCRNIDRLKEFCSGKPLSWC